MQTALLSIWQSSSPDALREIALTQFKNHAVDNFVHTRNTEEKEHCKRLLLTTYLSEKSEQLTKHIAQCIAKLARKEWPNHWHALFDILVANLKKDDAHSLLRTAMVLRDVLAEFPSMRLPAQRQATSKLSAQLMPILLSVWRKALHFTFAQLEQSQTPNADFAKVHQCLKLCVLLSKSLRVLLRRSESLDFSAHSVGGQLMREMQLALLLVLAISARGRRVLRVQWKRVRKNDKRL